MLRDVYHVTEDSEFLDAHELREGFWHVVDNLLTSREKRGLLLFVTGVAQVPTSKELMSIELLYTANSNSSNSSSSSALNAKEVQTMLGRVPESHTCDNLLVVPDYWRALIQAQRLQHDSSKALATSGSTTEPNLKQQVCASYTSSGY